MVGRDNTGTAELSDPSVAAHDARYHYERKLGDGGSGSVYLVRDLETGEQLALKRMQRIDSRRLLRLKREFRSLQSVNHPHLIKLYDMGQVGDAWFMTMDYLDGLDLSAYLQREARIAAAERETNLVFPRLIATFRQLARGVRALHEAGLLHRDLKPRNVIVVGHHVVVLDFGLVRLLSEQSSSLTADGLVAGTPAYMAPEQLQAKELSPASDWYAFGVMLYEAVSGRLPIDGALFDVLKAKIDADPAPLSAAAPDAPQWLVALCTALLQRDPALRPSGDAVLAQFDAADPQLDTVHTASELAHTETDVREAQARVFGRERELAQLSRALERVERDGRPVVVHVRAISGAGKSALVEHFVAGASQRHPSPGAADALALRSRCYELEAMPFKALDGVVDTLVMDLARRDDLEVAHLLPADVATLTLVFPVFERLNVVRRLAAKQHPSGDPVQMRRRAQAALLKLLENVSAYTPVLVWIDDLQWGDLDSAEVLRSWLVRPKPARILFVLSYRADEIATSNCLRVLLADSKIPSDDVLDLLPLPSAEIKAMCEHRLRTQAPERGEIVQSIVREAQGSPFLASQLIALADAKSARGDGDLQSLSLDLMVAQTSALLAPDAKQVLAVLAVAGRPMRPKLVLQAAGVGRGGRALVHDLRRLNLVRTRDVGGVRMLEAYHDRIRERVLGALAPEDSRSLHESLFRTLERGGRIEADWLHTLALGAGHSADALRYGMAAAQRASASFAFERAAQLYRTCIGLDPDAGAVLWKELSMALARCGRGLAAADAALEAAKYAEPDDAVFWLQLAAAHCMRSGHYARGTALVQDVLVKGQIRVPDSDAGVMAAITWERARLKLRGTAATERPDGRYPAELLKRVDVYMGLWAAVQVADPLRAMLFQLRAFRAALDAGEPSRLVRALCAASNSLAIAGAPSAEHDAQGLVARAQALSAQLPVPDELTIVSTHAINAFIFGRFHEALTHADEAEQLFRTDTQDDPSGNYNRRMVTSAVRLGMLQLLADYPRLLRELSDLVDAARAADNRSILLHVTYTHTLAEQIQGRAARSRERLDGQREHLPASYNSQLRLLHMVSVVSTACWTRDYAWAHALLEQSWPRFLRLPLRGRASVSIMLYESHGRLLLNEHVESARPGAMSQQIEQDVRELEKFSALSAKIAALGLRARLAYLHGDQPQALAELRARLQLLEGAGYRHDVERTRFALAAIAGAVEACAAAREAIAALGVADVDADLRAQYPELTRAGLARDRTA